MQAANVAGSGLVCRNPSVNGGPQAGTASYDEIALARYVECVTGQMEDLIDVNDFPGAIRVAMSLDDLLQRANLDMPNFLGAASSLMCRGRQRALDTLVSITITDLDDLKVIQAVGYWDMFAQKIGHVCPGQPDLNTAVQPKIDDALTLLDVDPDNITTADVGSTAYISARAMAERSLKLRHELVAIARALGRPVTSPIAQAQAAAAGNAPKARANAAVPGNGYSAEALAEAQLQGRLEPAVLKNLLPSPWQRCRSANDFVPLMALFDVYGALDALKSAAQYCGTSLQVSSRNASGSTLDQLAQPLGGVSAGVQHVSGSIQATDTGALSVIGPIQALRCPADPNGSSENLVLKMDGHVFQTLVSSPYLNNLSDIDIGAALAAAHPGATSGLTQAVLTVERTGSTCVGFWGPAPSPLLSLTLTFPSAVSALMLAYQPEPDGFRPGTYVAGTPAIPLVCSEGGGPCINPELNELGSNAALPFTLAARGVVLNVTQIGSNVFAVDADVTKGQGQEMKIGLQFSSVVPGRLNVEKNESWQTYPVSASGSECVQLRDNASSLILTPGTPAIVNLFVSAHTVVCTHFAHPEEMAGRGRMVTITFVPD